MNSKKAYIIPTVSHLFLLFFIFLSACNNASKQDEVRKDFDSINKALKDSEVTINSNSEKLYDSLVTKLSTTDTGGRRQFYYAVHDFYGYLSDVRRKFLIAAGDSAGQSIPTQNQSRVEVTNNFIADKNQSIQQLYPSLKSVLDDLSSNASNDSLKNEIKVYRNKSLIGAGSSGEFLKRYFQNMPPTAVITILNSFEQNIKRLEAKVLSEFYNK